MLLRYVGARERRASALGMVLAARVGGVGGWESRGDGAVHRLGTGAWGLARAFTIPAFPLDGNPLLGESIARVYGIELLLSALLSYPEPG